MYSRQASRWRYDGDVIGVLEYINRRNGPPYDPFTPEEMDRAAIYADSIASLVNAYNAARLVRELSEKVLSSDDPSDLDEIRTWLSSIRESEDHRERMELAVMLREIAHRGEPERKLCRELLDAVLRFSDEKNEGSFLSF